MNYPFWWEHGTVFRLSAEHGYFPRSFVSVADVDLKIVIVFFFCREMKRQEVGNWIGLNEAKISIHMAYWAVESNEMHENPHKCHFILVACKVNTRTYTEFSIQLKYKQTLFNLSVVWRIQRFNYITLFACVFFFFASHIFDQRSLVCLLFILRSLFLCLTPMHHFGSLPFCFHAILSHSHSSIHKLLFSFVPSFYAIVSFCVSHNTPCDTSNYFTFILEYKFCI